MKRASVVLAALVTSLAVAGCSRTPTSAAPTPDLSPITVTTTSEVCNFDGPTGPQWFTWQGSTTGKLLVPTTGPCAWTATVDADWITLTGPALPGGGIGATGSGAVTYTVAQFEYSTAPPRVGNITVRGSVAGSGRTIGVRQFANCSGEATDVQLSFGPDGGDSGRIAILMGPPYTCPWRVISDADWITIAGAPTRLAFGDADLHIRVGSNPGSSSRTATVFAPYHNYIVTQASR